MDKELSRGLVITARGEPYTTSSIIAEGTGIEHRKLKAAIRKYKAELEAFGKVAPYEAAFEAKTGLDALGISAPYQAEIPGRGRKATGYILNEQQATFLLTLLKNTPVVVAFKKELVRQFYAMRAELMKRQVLRSEGKPIRRTLTDAIRDSGENERMKGHAYTAYTNLALTLSVGSSAAKLKKTRNVSPGAVATDALTSDELLSYHKKEAAIAVLLDAGLKYDAIKSTLKGSIA